MSPERHSFYEATARERVLGLTDPKSFREFVPFHERMVSPHLPLLGLPVAFNDGVIVGSALLGAKPILVAAQEGAFQGGAVGEVHGAKLTGLLERACEEKPAAVLLLLDSGGVRLHEANAGLIAVSEIMRALARLRTVGVPAFGLIGGANGCFGGMSIVARMCNAIIMSEEGRLGLSGPEVIETVHGVEEFDSRDRALVWRTVGGKHRYLLKEADLLVDDDIAAFRAGAISMVESGAHAHALSMKALELEHAALADRLARFGNRTESTDIWRAMGVAKPERLPLLDTESFLELARSVR
ncbi:MAG TPA: biotin-independent malonate decarboxylase subunit beta [Burkholderiales bacterium]|nr:biotin-independent malonate decarboxylase subunit beta [Burkholderiales bacterium]